MADVANEEATRPLPAYLTFCHYHLMLCNSNATLSHLGTVIYFYLSSTSFQPAVKWA